MFPKRGERKRQGREEGGEDTEWRKREKKGKRDLGYFELITHSSLSSSEEFPSYEKKLSGLSWLIPWNVQIIAIIISSIIINIKSQSVSGAIVISPHVCFSKGFPSQVKVFR